MRFTVRSLTIWSLTLSICAPATTALVLKYRAPSIPGPPADPPLQSGDGSGKWHAEEPSIGDRVREGSFHAMATAARGFGLNHAADNLDHYLDNKGTDFNNDPGAIMSSISDFKESVRALATQEASSAFKAASIDDGTTKTFQSQYKPFYATETLSKDWFFALGGFSYAVSGSVSTRKNGGGWVGDLFYRVYIFDRYNWDNGKGVNIGPFTFTDRELGHMHVVGLAREFIVRGSSEVFTVNTWDGTVVPSPPNGGGRG